MLSNHLTILNISMQQTIQATTEDDLNSHHRLIGHNQRKHSRVSTHRSSSQFRRVLRYRRRENRQGFFPSSTEQDWRAFFHLNLLLCFALNWRSFLSRTPELYALFFIPSLILISLRFLEQNRTYRTALIWQVHGRSDVGKYFDFYHRNLHQLGIRCPHGLL